MKSGEHARVGLDFLKKEGIKENFKRKLPNIGPVSRE